MTLAVRLTYNTVAVFRKTLTIFSLIGLLLSVGVWGASYFFSVVVQRNGFGCWEFGAGCIGFGA